MTRKRRAIKGFRRASRATFGGALATQAAPLLSGTKSASQLSGSISGFTGIGVAGTASDVAFKMASGKYRRKRKRR